MYLNVKDVGNVVLSTLVQVLSSVTVYEFGIIVIVSSIPRPGSSDSVGTGPTIAEQC